MNRLTSVLPGVVVVVGAVVVVVGEVVVVVVGAVVVVVVSENMMKSFSVMIGRKGFSKGFNIQNNRHEYTCSLNSKIHLENRYSKVLLASNLEYSFSLSSFSKSEQ